MFRLWRRIFLLAACGAGLLALPLPGSTEAVLTADEFRLLPLRLHLLRARAAPDLNTTLETADALRILGKINAIWSQAGIQFYADGIHFDEAANQELYQGLGPNRTEGHLRLVRPRATLSDRSFHLYYIGRMGPNGICLNGSYQLLFVKQNARLNRVPGGIDEPLPRVSAHEIGHALSLDHRQDTFNLMASGTTGTGLNAAEVAAARRTAESFDWSLQPAEALALAERMTREQRDPRALYRALAALPGGDVARAARRQLDRSGE